MGPRVIRTPSVNPIVPPLDEDDDWHLPPLSDSEKEIVLEWFELGFDVLTSPECWRHLVKILWNKFVDKTNTHPGVAITMTQRVENFGFLPHEGSIGNGIPNIYNNPLTSIVMLLYIKRKLVSETDTDKIQSLNIKINNNIQNFETYIDLN